MSGVRAGCWLLALALLLASRHAASEVIVGLRGRNEAGLFRLLALQEGQPAGPRAPWLTPGEFAARFGASARAVRRVSLWLRGSGCAVQRVPGRQFVRCRHADPGAPPAHVAALVDGMVDPRAFRLVVRSPVAPESIGTRGDFYFSPVEFWRTYGIDRGSAAGLDGHGVTIGLLAASQIGVDDLAAFRSLFALPPADFVQSPGLRTGGLAEAEASLDASWAGAIAPGARVFLAVALTPADAHQLLVGSNVADVISSSIDLCPTTRRARAQGNRLLARTLRQARAQGQTVLIASGDSGTRDCADGGHGLLASSPLVIAVGGTSPSPVVDAGGNATAYGTESVWNDGTNASGGGPTALARPAYQRGVAGAGGKRALPDVALPASSVYPIVLRGSRILAGGTSAASPAWAGVVARLVQQRGRVGFINPRLYQLGRAEQRGGPAVFHDVVTGDNRTNGGRGYPAGPGYDLATGWGSVDAAALLDAFGGP
jgi:subtilase family serine protease